MPESDVFFPRVAALDEAAGPDLRSVVATDASIELCWRRGKTALDLAIRDLLYLSTSCPSVAANTRETIDQLEHGAFAEVLARSEIGESAWRFDDIRANVRIALQARNEVLELAVRAYGASLRGAASRFHSSGESEDDISRAWMSVTCKIYSWRGEGTFVAWLNAIGRRALLDGIRTARKVSARIDLRVEERPDPQEGRAETHGTMTVWLFEMLRCFRKSLDSERRIIWDEWEHLGEEGMRPEEIYRELACRHDKTLSAVKMTLHRLECEFRELIGADKRGIIDVSNIVAMWVGSERRGPNAAVMVTGIDVEDRVRLLAASQVQRVTAHAFKRVFWTLRRWGLPQGRRILVVADDSEGLEDAISVAFPGNSLVQPCQDHFMEALIRQVLPVRAATVRRAMRRALASSSVTDGRCSLLAIADSLATHSPGACAFLRQWLEALLTVKSLQLPLALEKQLTRVEFFAEWGGTSSADWLGGLFQLLRLRRSVQRRREGLHALLAHLGST